MRSKDKTFTWLSSWWKTRNERWWIYMSDIHWVDRGTGIPKDRDEVNRREVWECDGWLCDLDMIVVPSKLSGIGTASTSSLRDRRDFILVYYESIKWKIKKDKKIRIFLNVWVYECSIVYYESIKRKLKTKYIWVSVTKSFFLLHAF